MNIHPKTSGAGLGGALGLLIVAVLHSIPGVHLPPEAAAAIPTGLSALTSWLVPAPAADSISRWIRRGAYGRAPAPVIPAADPPEAAGPPAPPAATPGQQLP